MGTNICQRLADEYARWLRKHTAIEAVGEVCRITTPFLDRHNDHLEIYAVRTQEGVRLTDDGYVLSDLELSGWKPSTPHRKSLLDAVTRGLGVTIEDGALVVEARRGDVPQKKHRLVQAMLAVNDLFATAEPRVVSLFLEDVARFLKQNEIRFTPDVKFTGRTGFDHHFDFAIPASSARPERIIRAIRAPSQQQIALVAFAWADTRKARPVQSQLYAMLNDSERPVSPDYVHALRAYAIEGVPWSQRADYVQDLAA